MALDWKNDDTIRYLLQGTNRKQGPIATPKRVNQYNGYAKQAEVEGLIKDTGRLQDLINETAETTSSSIGQLSHDMQEQYLAKSDYGEYEQQIYAAIEASARQITEQFSAIESTLEAVSDVTDGLNTYVQTINGEIRRGFITDPTTGDTAVGIVISENLQFTGQVMEQGGLTFYELSPGQTVGIYTSTGWQFWINGQKRGWFDSESGDLVTISQQMEGTLKIGPWQINPHPSANDYGFGIKYVGG